MVYLLQCFDTLLPDGGLPVAVTVVKEHKNVERKAATLCRKYTEKTGRIVTDWKAEAKYD